MSLTSVAKKAFKRTPLWKMVRPRRTHVYGIGAMKTGTHSIYGLFEKNYHATHEAHVHRTIRLLLNMQSGKYTRVQLSRRLRSREREWRLEVEAAHYLAPFGGVLAECFPEAKFILTVRDPRSWLNSVINQCLKRPRERFYGTSSIELRDFYFSSPPSQYPDEEAVLGDHNLHTIDGYLSYWAWHNRNVLDAIPPERLLVIRTSDISNSATRVAEFARVPANSLSLRKSHKYRAKKDYKILDSVDERYVQDKMTLHCSSVVRRLADIVTGTANWLK